MVILQADPDSSACLLVAIIQRSMGHYRQEIPWSMIRRSQPMLKVTRSSYRHSRRLLAGIRREPASLTKRTFMQGSKVGAPNYALRLTVSTAGLRRTHKVARSELRTALAPHSSTGFLKCPCFRPSIIHVDCSKLLP